MEDPWTESIAAAAQLELRPSRSVKNLYLCADFNQLRFHDLSQLFPNISELEANPRHQDVPTTIPYEHVWTSWPHLASLILGVAFVAENFDAAFLGINPEECDILRELDDESLDKMNIVSVRPSILTMLGMQ